MTEGSPPPPWNALKKIPGLRSTYYLGIVLRQLINDRERDPRTFDVLYSSNPDPWGSQKATERARFALTLELLRGAAPDGVGTAVEIGCGEGMFTELLAPTCRHLLAVDYSTVAISHASERLSGAANVEFGIWDMRREKLPAVYDLVVAMGVLTSLLRPHDVRRASQTLIEGLRPGGLLLFSDVRQSPVFESAWWGPFLLRGGYQVRRLLSQHPQLELLRAAETDTHVFAVFRRVEH